MYEHVIERVVRAALDRDEVMRFFDHLRYTKLPDVEAMLRENKALANAQFEKYTALTYAMQFTADPYDKAKLLLECGADPNEKAPPGDYPVVLASRSKNEKMLNLLAKYGAHVPSSSAGKVQEAFEFQGFTVIYAGYYPQMKKLLTSLSKTIKKMRSLGFGHLMYGPLIVTSQELEGPVWNEMTQEYKSMKWGAYYDHSKDRMVVNEEQFYRNISYNMQLFAHELGHRQWYKFLSPTQRATWTGKYEERGFKIQKPHVRYIAQALELSAPAASDSLGFRYRDWNEFDYKKFLGRIRRQQEKHHLLDVLDAIVGYTKRFGGNPKTARRKWALDEVGLEPWSFGGRAWCAQNIDIFSRIVKGDTGAVDELTTGARIHFMSDDPKNDYKFCKKELERPLMSWADRLVGKMLQAPTSTTEYGRNNTREDYAEAFGNFMANQPMPREIYNLFLRVHDMHIASETEDGYTIDPLTNVALE